MALTEMTPTEAEPHAAARRRSTRLLACAAGVGMMALMGAAILLWMQHGTAVFFETLSAGLAACF